MRIDMRTMKQLFTLISMMVFTYTSLAENQQWKNFLPPADDKFDWIQLTSDEWLKGELKSLYHYKLEFDSDELDLLTFDFEDIKQIRTHQPYSASIEDPSDQDNTIELDGKIRMEGDRVEIYSSETTTELTRKKLISIAKSAKQERNLWSADISLGANIRKGNTDAVDITLRASTRRLSATSRLEFNYLGYYTETDDTKTANNHRLSGLRDSFISKRLFWRQIFAEYYRDPFKNIDSEVSLYSALGYYFIYTPKTKWDVSAGLGVRELEYISVESGQDTSNTSPALVIATLYDAELSKAVDLLVNFNFQFVDEDSGTYTHHFITTLKTDLMKDIDFDVSLIWDRIEEPRVDSDGVEPEQDDYQIVVGLTIEY